MTSLAVGASVTLPIQGSETYTVVSNFNTFWSATFTPANSNINAGGGGGRSYGPQGTQQTFGPYGIPGTLVITNGTNITNTALTYTYSSALYSTDSSGNVNGLMGVGGGVALNFVGGLIGGTSTAATANTTSINTILAAGGYVYVPAGLGDVYVNATLIAPSITNFVVGRGSRIRLAPNSNCNILRNTNWGSAQNAVTQVSTPDLGITVVVQSATLPAVGSAIILLGASPRVYNGAYRVLTSGAGQFTAAMSTHLAPTETPTTPATGTIVWMQADYDISVEGEFDYDGLNQTTPDTWQKHGLYLRRLVNFTANVKVKNVTKYALALGNIYNSRNITAHFDTLSDGIHILGSGDDVSVTNVTGITGDDMVAVGNSDYAQYVDSAWALGDFGVIRVDNIFPNGSLTAFKYFGCASNVAKSISIGSIQGRISGGQGFVNLINDTGATGGTASTIEKFEVARVAPNEAISNACINTSGAITVGVLDFNIRCSVNNVATARPVQIGVSSVVNKLRGSLTVDASTYSANAFGVYVSGTVIDGAVDGNLTNINIALFIATSAGASRFALGKWLTNNCGQAYRNISATSQVLHIDHIERNGYQSSPHIDMSNTAAGTTFSCNSSIGLQGTDAYGGSGANKTVLYAPQIGIDVGGTGVVRQAGALVFHNSGTARGTLVANNLVVCDNTGAANSWKQLSNTTLAF